MLALSPALQAQSIENACWSVDTPPAQAAPGRWSSWKEEALNKANLTPGERKVWNAFAPFEQLLRRLPVLNPPPDLEVMVGHSATTEHEAGGKPHHIYGDLHLGFFHPTYKKARETSTWIRVYMNNPVPLTNMLGSVLSHERENFIYEPLAVGTIAGATVYGYPEGFANRRDCLVVFPANDTPLWEPVSRERYVRALIQEARDQLEETLRDFREAEAKQPDAAELRRQQEEMRAEQKAMLEMMRKLDPQAAQDLEEQFAMAEKEQEEVNRSILNPEIDALRAKAVQDAKDRTAARIAELEAELAAMGPARRASQAWVGGRGYSEITLLNAPDAPGARPVAAANKDYIDPTLPPQQMQIIIVALKNRADHLPENYIMTQVRRQLEWKKIWNIIEQSRLR